MRHGLMCLIAIVRGPGGSSFSLTQSLSDVVQADEVSADGSLIVAWESVILRIQPDVMD